MTSLFSTMFLYTLMSLLPLWIAYLAHRQFKARKRSIDETNSTASRSSHHQSRSVHTGITANHESDHPHQIQKESDPSGGQPITSIKGPGVPQEITFFVTTPPSKNIPVLHTGTKYKSIKRQLAFNLQNMTWEIRKPQSIYTSKAKLEVNDGGTTPDVSSSGTGTITVGTDNVNSANSAVTSSSLFSKKSESGNASMASSTHMDPPITNNTLHDSDIVWKKAEKSKIVPVESLLNVSAFVPDKCATVEINFVNSHASPPSKSTSDNLLSNMVTLDNWKTHTHDSSVQKNKRGGERNMMSDDRSLSFEEESFDDSSTSASMLGTFASGGGGVDNIHSSNAGASRHNSRTQKDKGSTRTPRTGSKKKSRLKEETREFTFDTELDAGAFQTLFLAMRIVGRDILNLYNALELVHKSSEAYDGSGYDDGKGGVALDDVLRCLGDLPFVGKRIERVYQYCADTSNHLDPSPVAGLADQSTTHSFSSSLESFRDDNNDNNDNDNDKGASSTRGRADEYNSKRMVLGYVDFFRLFIPKILHGTPYATPVAECNLYLSDTELDGIEEHHARVRQMVTMRQRVAKAAVRVSAYVNAMKIVNEGWEIPIPSTDHSQARKRLSFDHEDLNLEHDRRSENEYYDPMLSRKNQPAYALVGYNTVRLSPRMARMDSTDPVDFIPTLRTIIDKNPQSDFFVSSLLHKKERLITILLFVKWLPKGIDEAFDEAFDRFTSGSAELRNDILHLSSAYATKYKSILSSMFGSKSVEHTSTRQIPVMKFLNGVKHFGGSLRTDPQLPSNYLSVLINTGRLPGQLGRIMGRLVPATGVSPHIVDFDFRFQDIHRSVASARTAHLNSCSIISFQEIAQETSRSTSLSDDNDSKNGDQGIDGIGNEGLQDLDTLRDILSEITVPSRYVARTALGTNRIQRSKDHLHDVQVLHLFENEKDITRHYIAAKKDLKEAAIRITKCAAFRGLTFPIDTRLCRVELCSGQFFQQGKDLDGNPVFYFRNFCAGLWRRDVDASLLAVLHRLESAFVKLSKMNSNFKCTLVVLMGKPIESKTDTTETNGSSTCDEDTENVDGNIPEGNSIQETVSNKVTTTNEFHIHTNFRFVQRLLDIVSQNYPERLNRALVIPAGGWEKMFGTHGLRRYINSSKTRSKVTILGNEKDLEDFVSQEELIDLAGGQAQTMSFDVK